MATMTVEGLLATITALTEGLKLKRKELGELWMSNPSESFNDFRSSASSRHQLDF